MNIVGGTVEEIGKRAISAGKKSFQSTVELVDSFIESLTLSVNLLIFLGHGDAWEYDYETYKTACRHAKAFEKQQVITFATAISLVFGGKRAVQNYLKSNEETPEQKG